MTTYLINGTTPLPLNGSTGWGTLINNALISVDGRFTYTAPNYSLASNVVGSSLTSLGTLTSLAVSGAATIGGALTVTGNLTVNGTTTTINSTTITTDDVILTLGGDTAPVADDNKDRGIEFRWHNGSAAKLGFFGYDDSTGKLTFIPDATNTSNVFSGTLGTIDVGAVHISGSQIAASNLSNGVTGSGSVVLATSPTLATPVLGVASATSVNKVAITAPATSATLTIADGKTLTASNTLTFTGTDSSSVAFGTGGTVAYLASPTFTGTPTLPTGTIATTQSAADSSTKVATTAFVTTADNLKADIASPTFTGTPLSTTAAVDTNTTQIATTAYVVGQGYAKLASPTFTGTPTLPTGTIATTQSANNNTTAVATTAYVDAADALKANLASPTLTSPVLISAEERWNVVAGAPSSTQNIDIKTSAAWCYTSNTTTGFTPNFRGDGSTTLASLVAVGDSITISISVTNGTTAYVSTAIQIDSVSVTPKWLGGSAPTAGNVSSTDVYSYTIIKLDATPTYTVFASQTRFA